MAEKLYLKPIATAVCCALGYLGLSAFSYDDGNRGKGYGTLGRCHEKESTYNGRATLELPGRNNPRTVLKFIVGDRRTNVDNIQLNDRSSEATDDYVDKLGEVACRTKDGTLVFTDSGVDARAMYIRHLDDGWTFQPSKD